ncbi:UvrD-helicase domain-containing protein [Mesorhizobium sp.]|jgi:superfamily I DNA/RNA helicase|uniref:UvrD-helicase domain-containing protein n=1 Tax=Mesorhizobium sp. TaxID=1871066 RepID=UPI00356849BC
MFVKPENWKPTPGISLEGTALDVVKSAASVSVLAGPGAGKTELLAQRAAYLLNTGLCPPPKRILAIAFKVDAAGNLQSRVEQRCEPEVARRFESLTLHAFAKRTLDQFREALNPLQRPSPDYKIIFPNRDTWEAFRRNNAAEYPDLNALNNTQISQIVQGRLPTMEGEVISQDRIRRAWWRARLRAPSTITFDMIIQLATHIVETEPLVRGAIATTYMHVFLDEFQDVTGQQYDLVRRIFQGTSVVVTAVGDTNQAIMGWAGALPGIFSSFSADFTATNRRLQFNFRSNATIVELINNLSELFTDEEPVRTESGRRDDPSPPDAVEGWMFPGRDSEGVGIANFISGSLSADAALKPHDFVILARLRADDVEKRLAPKLAEKGLRLRNDARSLGPLSIQDLAKEPVFLFITSLLKMAHGVRDGSPFQVCRDFLANLEGVDLGTDRGAARSLRAVQDLVQAVTRLTKDTLPHQVAWEELAPIAFPEDRKDQLARTFKGFQDREYLHSVIEACLAFYRECTAHEPSWPTFIDNVEGRDVVRIMTIHKSKGLEYHTVIFTEFNDDAFWNNADDVNVFFVALSRARERIRFSLTRDARGFKNVSRFIEKLMESGVRFEEMA